MNPKYEHAAERIRELITEGHRVAALEQPSEAGPYIKDKVQLHAWLVKGENIIRTIFGINGAHFAHLSAATKRTVEHAYTVNKIIGILSGALNDLEGGFLAHQEQLIAALVFDSVLEQARHLTNSGFKDPAAVLCRVVVEESLRRLSRQNGLQDSGKATVLNDVLRDSGRYNKPQWRVIQSWLDIGNSAAHGKFSEYDAASVIRMIDDIERFVGQELGS